MRDVPDAASAGPLVSVILPVYNGEQDVERAIQSIQAQTYQRWELLIRDDGSRDGTLAVCRALAMHDGRITVEANERNLGLAATMNRLVRSARGELIAIQEHDDVSDPQRLEWEVDAFAREPEVGVVSGIAAWVDRTGRVLGHFPGMLKRGEQFPQSHRDMVRFLYVKQSKVVNAACMFRRTVVEGQDAPFDERARMSVDWQFFVRAAHRFRILGIPRVLLYATRDIAHQSLSRNRDLRFVEARRCLRVLYRAYRADPNSPIDFRLYRAGMSTELVIEGRMLGGMRGAIRLFGAIACDASNRRAWQSLRDTARRGVARMTNRRSRVPSA